MKTVRRNSDAMFSLACTVKEENENLGDEDAKSSLASRDGDEQNGAISRSNSRAPHAFYDSAKNEFKRMTDQEDCTIKRITDQEDYTIKRTRSGSGSFVFSIVIQRSSESTNPRCYPIKASLEQRVQKSIKPSHPGNGDPADHNSTRVRPRAVSFSTESLLCSAIARDDVSEICCLIDRGDLNPNKPNETGITPLHRAAIDGSYRCLDFLLSRGADVDVIDNDGWTPLHDTVFHGHVQCAKRLLVSGANVEMETNNFVKPIEMAEDEEMIVVIGRAMASNNTIPERETLPGLSVFSFSRRENYT